MSNRSHRFNNGAICISIIGRNHHLEWLSITSVERQQKNKHRYNIFINDVFALSVHEDMLVKYRLLKGEQIETANICEIVRADELHVAYLKAIRFLSIRPRSTYEMKVKLKQLGYDPDVIQITLDKLFQLNYLNDEEYTKNIVEQKIHYQKKGRLLIKQELKQKGVPTEHISRFLDGVDNEEEFQIAMQLASKKWENSFGDEITRKRKLIGFLLRRGYSSTIVQQIVRKLNVGIDEEDAFS